MYSPFQLALKFFRYWIKASNGKGHGIHSPFVFEFVTKVLNGDKDERVYDSIESMRRALLRDDKTIEVQDFGAGSRTIATTKRQVKKIASTSLKPKKYSQLLHRIVRYYKPSTVLEIGTSLGVTTAYLAKASPSANVITLEGAKEIASIAKTNFDSLGIDNIRQVIGNFDETLQGAVSGVQRIDLAFIDGNHRFQPTIAYFNTVLAKSGEDTIIILDDIYWSEEMEQAWQWVKEHERTRLTIDLFAIGIVVLRPSILHKQHFCIRY